MANPLLTDEQNRRLANQNSTYNQIMQGFAPVQQQPEDSLLGGLSRGAKAGFGGLGAGLLHAGQAAFGTDGSMAASLDAMAENNAQRRNWDLADTFSLDYLTSPDGLAYGIGQIAGSMALPALFGAGVAAAVPSGGTSLLGTGALIGAAGAAPMAISEGGNTYAQGLQQGMTEDEAKKAGLTDAAIKLPFYMLSEGLSGKVAQGLISKGLLNAEGKSLGRRAAESGAKILGNAGNEAYEEATENRSSAYALGDQRISGFGNIFNPFDWNDEDKAQAVGVFTPTLALGTLTGGAGHLRSRFNKKNTDVSEEIASEDGGTIEEAPEATVSGREAFINAIAGQESGGNYNAENSDTGAYGKYQILPSNWPEWAEEAGIGADAPRTPENQEIVARFKLGQYYDKYGARGAAIAWYGGEGALNYSEEALNRKQGDNGEYPSINEYADEVLGRMGNVADSVRIDDTEENYFDESNYTDDTIPGSLINPVRGFDVSHLVDEEAQDTRELFGEKQDENIGKQNLGNDFFSNIKVEQDKRAKAIKDIARAVSQPNTFDELRNSIPSNYLEQMQKARAVVPVNNNAVGRPIPPQTGAALTMQRGRNGGLNTDELAIMQKYQGNPDAFNRQFKKSVEAVRDAVNRGDITPDVGRAYMQNLGNMYNTVAGTVQNDGVILQGQDPAIIKMLGNLRDKRRRGDTGALPSLLQENGNVDRSAAFANRNNPLAPLNLPVRTPKEWDKAEAEYKARAEEKAEKHTRQQSITDIINARAAQKWDEAENINASAVKKDIDITIPKGVTAEAKSVTNKKTGKKEVELKFSGKKISDEFKKKLRAHGFNWNVGRKAWVAEENIVTKAVAEKLTQKDNGEVKNGKEEAERIDKTEEQRGAESNTGETRNSEAEQAEAEHVTESNQDEVNKKAVSVEENIANGEKAVEKVISEHTDVIDAMKRDDVGGISFYYGTPGTGKKFKKGYGIAHMIAKRNSEGVDGEAFVKRLPEVIAKGKIAERQTAPNGDRVLVKYGDITTVLSLYKDGNRQTWVVTGWDDSVFENKKETTSSDAAAVYDANSATSEGATRSRSNTDEVVSTTKSVAQPAENVKKINLPKGTTAEVSIVGDNSNIIQVKFNGEQGKGTGGIMGRAGYKWKSDKQVWQARRTEKAMDVAEQLGYKPTEEMSEDKSQQTDKYKNYSKEDIKINKERLATMPDVDSILQPAAKKFAEFFKARFPKSDYTYETVDFWNNYTLEFEQLNKILKKYRKAVQQGNLSMADAHFQQISSSFDRINDLLEKLVGNNKEMRQEFADSITPFFDEYHKIADEHNAKDNAKKTSKAKKQQGKQEYKYYLNARPADVGAVPKGFIRVDAEDKGGRYGAIYYDRQLSDKEVQQYELKSDADVSKEKAQTEAVKEVSRELLKSDKVAMQAKNNTLEDFTLAYYDDIENYLADHIEENPVYEDLLNDPVIIDKAIESESIIKNTYEKLREKPSSEDTTDKPGKNKKITDKQEAKQQKSKIDYGDKKAILKDLLAATGLKEKNSKVEDVEGLDYSDAGLEEALNELAKECSKLSANPMFNPALYRAAAKVGLIFLKRTGRSFKRWAKALLDWFRKNRPEEEEKIKPFLGAIYKNIENWPKDLKFKEDIVELSCRLVGSSYADGNTSFEAVYRDITDMAGEENAQALRGYLEQAYLAVDELENPTLTLDENVVESDKGGSQYDSNSTESLFSDDTGIGNTGNEIRTTSKGKEPRGSNGQGSKTPERESERNGNSGVHGSRTSAGGKTSAREGSQEASSTDSDASGSTGLSNSVVDSLQEQPNVNEGAVKNIIESASDGRVDATDEVTQKINEVIKENNLDQRRADRLRETAKVMPFLTAIQLHNTDFVAERFDTNGKQGVMITDGTGTGKTFSGLAIVKKMFDEGKKNIIIAAPNDTIINQWIDIARDFYKLEVTRLKDTDDAGEGIVITTYANFGENEELVKRNWDMVICDESHNLMNSEGGKVTNILSRLRLLTYHPTELRNRAEQTILSEDKIEARKTVRKALALKTKEPESLSAKERSIISASERIQANSEDKLTKEETAQIEAQAKEWEELNEAEKPKVMFLSATPFAYVNDIDYANGYLFDYPKLEGQGYNQPNGLQQFLMEHFGYRMRYNKLTKPDGSVDNALMEMEFHEWLRNTGALTGHELEIDKDYNRGFILVDQGVGKQIDEGFEFLRENKEKYGNLEGVLNKQFDGRRRNYLLESIKARASVPIIREYLKAGKKVVVFHETNVERESFNPFRFTKETIDWLAIGSENAQQIKHEWDLFAKERPDLVNLNLDELSEPRRIYEEAFGDEAMFFNGRVPKKKRAQYVAAFNNDNSGKNLIIVQQDAGNAGISLHDTTGKYPRVEVNINIPRRPSFMIQIDGRIYRLGCMSNAIIRYLTTGTNIENNLFASTVAGRTSTAENLALGRKARGLRDSIIGSYQKTLDGTWVENLPGTEGEDVGGKESDRNMITSASDYDRAKGLYYGRGKKTAKTKAAEGVDYFATPEPIGYKMVQWANVKAGDKILEPSAGHGAISRFFSPTTENTIIEPSGRLAPQAQMNTENAKLINGVFEDLHISNKYDAITMNPPFGTGGKTAIEHLSKAFGHLREGGRVIALIPRGGMADKRFTKWYESDEAKNAHMVGEVLLPNVTFERAGTKVATRIVIIDKGGESQGVKRVDLSRINNINELFDNLESVEMPARQTKQTDVGAANIANSLRKGDAEGNSEVVTADSYKHTKTGAIIPSAKLNANLSDEEYRKVKSLAGKNGGYYSRYAKAFLFQDNENGRDKFVEEVNGANNTQYSVSSEAVQRAKEEVEAEIRAAFPNGKVEYVNGVPTITMPNGSKFQYSIRENIVVNAKEQRKADAAHGTSGARVQGFWKKFTGNGVQRMLAVSQNSERGTAFHEAMHAAIDLVLTEKEKNALYNYYEKKAKEQNRDVDEVIADAYRDWVLARQRKSGTMFGKLWRKVKDFCTRIKALFDKGAEVERIMQDVESGRVYKRGTTGTAGRSGGTHYSVASPKHKIANAFTNTERKGVVDSAKDFFKEHRKSLYQDWFDKNNPLKGFDALTKATGGLSVYDQVQSLPATTAGMLKALTEGTAQHVKMANQHLKNVKMKYNVTLAMALEKIDKKQMDKAYPKYLAENGFDNWVNALGAYLGAERCLEMAQLARAEGKTYKFPKGLTEQECQEFVKKAPQQFKAAADIFYKVNDNVISIMEDAEVFSHDLAKTLRTKYRKYCPLLRDFSDTAAADSFIGGLTEGGRGIGNVSIPLKRINIEGSERGVLNPLETILKSYAVMLNRAERNKVALMAVENSRTADLHELIQEVPGTTADPKNCVFTVLINGKKKAYKTTQDLYGPIVGYNLPDANLAFGVARTAARMLRTGATMSPSFILRNVLRDTVFAGIASKNGFIPIVDTIRGAIALAKDPAMRAEFEAAGVTEFNFYSSQKARIKSLDAMAGETPASAWEIMKAVFSRLEATSDFFESSTRMGEYMKARQKGLSMEEAARAAREVTLDFSRSGRIGEQVNQVVPFFNACLQGGDKMRRLFREDFVGTSLKVTGYIILPSLLLLAMNWDEDWYKDLDPDIKANYWCLGRSIRIPKPQEAGVLFGSGIEALFQQAAKKDKDAVSNWLKAFRDNMVPGVLPTLILPLIEWSANYSFFKGRPLVGNKYSRLPDELQYNDYTSELSKGIGSALKLSPMKIDNLVRGYTGTMGALLWNVLGEPFAKANNLPAKHFSELPFVRDFNVTDANLSRPMNEFYGILDKANRQHAGYGVKGKPEAAVKGIRSAGSMISKIRKDIDKITHSNLTPERKRELIDKRKEKMNQIAKQATARYGKYFE